MEELEGVLRWIKEDDAASEWTCANATHHPESSSEVPENWVCPDCGSQWWDIHYGLSTMPIEERWAAKCRAALASGEGE